MPDLEVTVGADVSELLTKLGAAKAKLNQLTESQQELKASITDLNASFRINERELTTTNAKLQALNTSTKEGKAAAVLLRTELAQLANNSRTLSANLTTAKTELASTTAALKIQTKEVKAAETASGGFAKGLGKAYGGLRTLANILPGVGISGIVLLISGPLIAAFSAWYEKINGVSDAIKLLKINQDNLNEVIKEANKDAGKQTADLKILYQAATDVNLSTKDRLAAVKGLQNEFPEYFKNIKAETILNGGAKGAYDELTVSIIANARATAAKAKIDQLEALRLDNDFKKQKILIATTNELNAATAKLGGTSQIVAGLGATAPSQGLTKTEAQNIIKNRRDLALAVIDSNDKILQSQEEFLVKNVGLAKLAKAVELTIPPPKIDKVKIVKKIDEALSLIRKKVELIQTDTPEILIPVSVSGPDLDKLKADGKKAADLFLAGMDELNREQLAKRIEDMNQGMADGIKATMLDALSGIGEAIGQAIGEGKDLGQAIFGSIFQVLAQGIKELGKAMITLGTAKITIEKFKLAPGIATVVAGIATVALGALLQSAIPKFATGGFISGPGTGRSDSIMARVSNGEYIMTASTVSKFGKGFFDMINRGYLPPKFANGGSVGNQAIGGGQNIAVTVYGKISGRDIVISGQRATSMISRNG